jgi:hypothetical protein
MKRQITEAQRVASEERRARLRQIAKSIAEMPEAERAALAARISPVTVEGRTLSLHNACMVAMQSPSATVLGGFQQWKQAGRQVRKGEHGIGIWIPRFEGKAAEDAGELAGFIFGTVFDVSQTDETEVQS